MRRLVAMGAALTLPAAAAADAMPPGFVDSARAVPGLAIEMRYAGAHNFTGAPVDGYEAARCWLTQEAATALAGVQAELAPRGVGLKVFDCYRPVRAVQRFLAWANEPGDSAAAAAAKREFFPDVPKSELFARGYIAARSSHSRGSTVDLTLVDLGSGRPLDMGTPFDFFGDRAHPDAPGLPPDVVANRALLRDTMVRHGFQPYDKEWWHFTLKAEPFPDTSFDVPIR